MAELINLDTSGKPTVIFFLEIASPSWIILNNLNLIQLIDSWRVD